MSNQPIIDLIEELFSTSVYNNHARQMQSITLEMQEMLINLYKMLFELAKESNDRQLDNIKELAKQYAEMVLVSPIREQLENIQKQLENTKERLALTQEQLALTQEQLTLTEEQLALILQEQDTTADTTQEQ